MRHICWRINELHSRVSLPSRITPTLLSVSRLGGNITVVEVHNIILGDFKASQNGSNVLGFIEDINSSLDSILSRPITFEKLVNRGTPTHV